MYLQHATRSLILRQCHRRFAAAASSTGAQDIQLVEKLLDSLRQRQSNAESSSSAAGGDSYKGPAFNIKTFNNISPKGLSKLTRGFYKVGPDSDDQDAHAILLRSHKLQVEEVRE